MSIPLTLNRILLFTIFSLGAYTIQLFARTNSLFDQMAVQQSRLALPDRLNTPYNPEFIGVKALDDLFGYLIMFFYPIVDGGWPGLSLIGVAFGGQAVAMWTLSLVEAGRRGNRWKVAFFTSIIGTTGQLMGLGMIGPLYLLLHSLTAPQTNTRPTIASLTPSSTSYLATIPATMALVYLLPITLMALPTPTLLPLHLKLHAHNAWQIFPVSGALVHFVLRSIWPYNPPATPKNSIAYLRWVYKFALTVAVPAHLATVSMSLSTVLFPVLFNPTFAAVLHPLSVFIPDTGAFRGAQAANIAEGALWFLQWDYLLASAGYLVWSVGVRQLGWRATGENLGFGVGGFVKVAVRTAVMGPAAAAVVYVWERDEAVFAGEGLERKKGL